MNKENESDTSLNSHRCATKQRDLSAALYLRPKDIFRLYGIPSSTVCELAKHPDPAKRLPSKKIIGRSGHRGLRLFFKADVDAWLARVAA